MMHRERGQLLRQIDGLRSRAYPLTSRRVHQSRREEALTVGRDLDVVVDLLRRDASHHTWSGVLPIAEALIKDAARRLATVETALKIL